MANVGNTFDEDIDVKIIIKKNHVCKIKDIAIPESNIIEEVLEMKFLEFAYQVQSNDVVSGYTGYPMQTSSLPLLGEIHLIDHQHKKNIIEIKRSIEKI